MKTLFSWRKAVSLALLTAAPLLGQAPQLTVHHVERLANSHNPEMLYWFISPGELQPDNWKKHMKTIEDNGTFDFIFLTARNGVDFYDTAKMKPFFGDVVKEAHAHHIRIGLQLWTKQNDAPDDELQGAVVETELIVDAKGHAEFTAKTAGTRTHKNAQGVEVSNYVPVRSEVLAAYAFQKTGDGYYSPGSMSDVTRKIKVRHSEPGMLGAVIDDPSVAGKTLYVLTVHYHRFPDMFGEHIRASFRNALEAYKDVGFDGSALDEFRYMDPGRSGTQPYRSRIYTPGMDKFFVHRTGESLIQTLFTMRYVPKGKRAERDRAINEYMETVQAGPLGVETYFYDETARLFGPHAFHGIHDTWHNALSGDEAWGTGINWWTIPRDYGQTDETTPTTTREGISMANGMPQEYNQFYSRDLNRLLSEALTDARFNGRVHWHAMNDLQHWGIDIASPEALPRITEVENKVRLLNAFQAPRPQFNVLYLFGFPALLNWVQPEGARNDWDINGNLRAEEKAVAAWNMGYRGPLAPTVLIENGKIHADDHGGITYGGERFTAVVMIGPEFAKPEVTRVLEQFVRGGGKLLLDGTQTMDFSGNDARASFARLSAQAVGQGLTEDNMAKLGVPKLAIDEGEVYTDGSVVLGDTDSVLQKQPRPFTIRTNGNTYTGTYEGLVALRAAADGSLDKFAGGAIDGLACDGKNLLTLNQRSDLVLKKTGKGTYDVTIVGDATPTLR